MTLQHRAKADRHGNTKIGGETMPRKPRRVRGMRRPGAYDSLEYKKRWIESENRRLEEEKSKWRYGFSRADKTCICLLARADLA